MPVLSSFPSQAQSAVSPAGMNTALTEPNAFGPAEIARIRAGDRQIFEAMAEAYYVRLVRYAYRYVRDVAAAEDVIQDVLLGLWVGRARLAIQHSVSSYLYTAVRNRALNVTRHQRSEIRRDEQVTGERELHDWLRESVSPADDWDSEQEARFERYVTTVRQAVAALPPRPAEAFALRIEQGLSFAEVAEVMGLTLRSAQVTYMRAVQLLRERLASYAE